MIATMHVPFVDLKTQHRALAPEIEAAVAVAEQYGYAPLVRRLGCDEGAAEFYRLSDDLIAVAGELERVDLAELLESPTEVSRFS